MVNIYFLKYNTNAVNVTIGSLALVAGGDSLRVMSFEFVAINENVQ